MVTNVLEEHLETYLLLGLQNMLLGKNCVGLVIAVVLIP